MAPSKYRTPPQAPPLFNHDPDTLLKEMDRLLGESKALQDQVVADVKPGSATFKNVLLPFAQDDNLKSLVMDILTFYQHISTNEKLREASTEAEKKWDEFSIDSSMREDLFKLVDEVFKKQKDDQHLDPESRRLLEKNHKGYINMGLGVPAGSDRDRFKAIKKRLSELGIAFNKRLNEEKGGIWFTPEELDGLPADVRDGLKKGDEGSENEGRLFLTFKYPDIIPASKYCTNSETRRKITIGNNNKCNENSELFKEAIVLRDEAARILGYPNHATLRIEDKMAKTPKTVDDFLGDLRTRLSPGGAKELESLKQLKKTETGSDNALYLWDQSFYHRLMLEKDYKLDQNLVAEYFPLQTCIDGMLHIFEELFGLVFVKLEAADRDALSETKQGNDIIWHPDVHLFTVWNDESEGGDFVGYLYLDLHPRDNKYGHAANFGLTPGFLYPNGTRRYPATSLVCNFSKPTPKKPSLLKHDEVVTLFHELGHGIHGLVGRTIYSRFHGTHVVRDFVEAPSQMLENWCWIESQIKALSKHWSYLSPEYFEAWQEGEASDAKQPAEQMPDDLVNAIIATRHVNDALANLRQLHYAIFDMTLHEMSPHEALEEVDTGVVYNRLRYEITGVPGPESTGDGWEWGHGDGTFGHLMGGYDAGYYGYLFSQVYSTDMFYSVFRKDPLNKEEGRRYRHTILEKGGSRDEMESLKEFLGRAPSTESFYKELGLA